MWHGNIKLCVEWLKLNLSIGGVASAFFWGIVADVFGRRRVLSFTLLFDSILTLGQSTVNDYRILVLVRCLNGFLIGGPSTLVFTYLSDLVGAKRRQFYLNVTGMSFVAAWLILPGNFFKSEIHYLNAWNLIYRNKNQMKIFFFIKTIQQSLIIISIY